MSSAALEPVLGPDMIDHLTAVEWRFVVPPRNTTRVVIVQRKDGPFAKDAIAGSGYYYASLEKLNPYVDGQWTHVAGSTSGGCHSFNAAIRMAEEKWYEEYMRGKR